MKGFDLTAEQVAEHNARIARLKNGGKANIVARAGGEIAPHSASSCVGMTSVERRFYDSVRFDPDLWVFYVGNDKQNRFKLPGGGRRYYTPDFVIINRKSGAVICHEIKGPHIHNRGSREKFMSARAAYPNLTWVAWQWDGKQWKEIWR